MAILAQSDFTQADSTTTIPAPSVGPSPVVTSTAGTYGTTSNALAAFSAPNNLIAIYPVAQPNIAMKCKVAAVGGDGCMLFRVQDNLNFLMLRFTGSNLQVYRCVAGVFTQLLDLGNNTIAAGDTAEVWAKDEQIQVYRNNSPMGEVFTRQFITAGGVGFRNSTSDTTTKYDDMLARDVADVLTVSAMNVSPIDFAGSVLLPRPTYVYKGRDTAAADAGSVA